MRKGLPLVFEYLQGFAAFNNGILDNPYKPQTMKGKEWQRGWDAAYFRNKWKQYAEPRHDLTFVVE